MNKIVYRLFKIRHTSMVGDIFDEHCCLLGKEVLDNVFARDFLRMKEIPFTYKGKRYKRQYEWIFRGDVAKIVIGVKREYGIVGAMVYINYSKLRYEPYVAIVDCSDVFESIDVVANMVEGALNWVYKDSGITLCLEPWILAEGPSEAALGHSNKLDGSHLSPNFTLGEFTKSGSHPEIYNIPSHEAIANLKRLCTWLEELRKRYNDKYVAVKGDVSITLDMTGGGGALDMTSPSLSSRPSAARGEISQMRP